MWSLVQFCLALSPLSLMAASAFAAGAPPVESRSGAVAAMLEPADAVVVGELVTGEPISAGNVVVRGEYLDRPYRVSLLGRRVLVNGVQIASLVDRPKAMATVTDREFVARIERSLFWDATLIVFDDQTRLFVESNDIEMFLESMLRASTIEQKVQVVFEQADYDELAKDCVPTSQWRVALESFPSIEGLAYRFEAACTESSVDAMPAESGPPFDQKALARASQLDWFIYVLNVLGMLLAVVSLGVLITNPPKADARWIETLRSPEARRLVKRCLTLIVVLSSFDLVSTLTAESIGSFSEANPLAAFLIDDFSLLTSVKLCGTVLTTCLLWTQREYVGVQQASWWICFVLTLVTIRWVVVDSLFYV